MHYSQIAMINIFLISLLLAVIMMDYSNSRQWSATRIETSAHIGNLAANVILPKPPENF